MEEIFFKPSKGTFKEKLGNNDNRLKILDIFHHEFFFPESDHFSLGAGTGISKSPLALVFRYEGNTGD